MRTRDAGAAQESSEYAVGGAKEPPVYSPGANGRRARKTRRGRGARMRRGLLSRRLRTTWLFKFTLPGKMLTLGIFATAVTGLWTLQSPIYHLLMVLLVLGTAGEIAGYVTWPRIRLTGGPPPKLVAGREVEFEYTLTSRSRLPQYDVSAGLFDLPPEMGTLAEGPVVRRLGAGQSAKVAVSLTPRRRGVYEFPGPRVFTTFPFNLFRIGPTARGRCSLTVLPSFHPLIGVDVPVSTRYQPGGIALTSRVGESPEYIGSREWRPGDPTRRLDYRSWARLAVPVVREFMEEYYCRVALVLDTFVPRPRLGPVHFSLGEGDGARGRAFEAAISLSAAIADAVGRGEYILDVFAAGPELYVFRTGRHVAHFENVLEILAAVAPCRTNPFSTVAPALSQELTNISTVVAVLLDWDADRRRLCRQAAESGCALKVVIVRDAPTSLPAADDEDWAGPIAVLRPRDVAAGAVESL